MLTRLRCWLGRHAYRPMFTEYGSFRELGPRRFRMHCRHCERPTRLLSRGKLERLMATASWA